MSRYTVNGCIPSDQYLQSIDILLVEDAVTWAETDLNIFTLLSQPNSTLDTVSKFKTLFTEKYPLQFTEIAPISFNNEVADLKQKDEKALLVYYKWASDLLIRVETKDRLRHHSEIVSLSSLKSAMLDTVLKSFIWGIQDTDIRKEALQELVMPEQSLQGIYTLAEEVRRVKIKLCKLMNEDAKSCQLAFYKLLAEQNMPAHQLKSLMVSYNSSLNIFWSVSSRMLTPPASAHQSEWVNQQTSVPRSCPAIEAARLPLNERQPSAARVQCPSSSLLNLSELPDRTTSKNSYISGSIIWTPARDGPLCVKCSATHHISKECRNKWLSRWETEWLRLIVFGDWPIENQFLIYDNDHASLSSQQAERMSQANINFITYRVSHLTKNMQSVEMFIGDESGSSKRAHIENVTEPNQQQSLYNSASLSYQLTQSTQSFIFQGTQVPELSNCLKAKGKKQTDKQVVMNPIVDMINDNTGFIDKQTSIRQLMKNNKVDMTWMNLCAWSPSVCREMKRLLMRMPKKRVLKRAAQVNASVSVNVVESGTAVNSVNGHTQFLTNLIGYDKAFQIPCSVRLKDGTEHVLKCSKMQADQGSDMNMISETLAKQLSIKLHSLSIIDFADMIMKTADGRESLLCDWVYLEMRVQGIWRKICCFVTPEQSTVLQSEHLSLLLDISWLYEVNATISIRGSAIEVGDPITDETVRQIVGPELVFCRDHNLIMYLKALLLTCNDLSESDEESISSSEKLTDIEKGDDEKNF